MNTYLKQNIASEFSNIEKNIKNKLELAQERCFSIIIRTKKLLIT